MMTFYQYFSWRVGVLQSATQHCCFCTRDSSAPIVNISVIADRLIKAIIPWVSWQCCNDLVACMLQLNSNWSAGAEISSDQYHVFKPFTHHRRVLCCYYYSLQETLDPFSSVLLIDFLMRNWSPWEQSVMIFQFNPVIRNLSSQFHCVQAIWRVKLLVHTDQLLYNTNHCCSISFPFVEAVHKVTIWNNTPSAWFSDTPNLLKKEYVASEFRSCLTIFCYHEFFILLKHLLSWSKEKTCIVTQRLTHNLDDWLRELDFSFWETDP